MKILSWLITIIIISVLIFGLFYYKNNVLLSNSDSSYGEPSASIETTTSELIAHRPNTSVIGESYANKQVIMQNELAGKISKLNFSSADTVKENQILIELKHDEESAQLKAAKSTELLNRQTLERYMTLFKEQRISKENVDIATANLHISIAEVARISAIIDKKVIRAPFDALSGIHNLSIGQYIDANTNITELVGIDDFIWIDFKVPQIYPELPHSSPIKISYTNDSTRSATATIESISPSVNQGSRQLVYRAKLLNKDLALKPNHLVKVTFPIGPESQVITVPDTTIVRDQLGDYVFKVIKAEDDVYRATKVKVSLGIRLAGEVIVEHGLIAGDLVVSKGAFKLREGMKTSYSPTVAVNETSKGN